MPEPRGPEPTVPESPTAPQPSVAAIVDLLWQRPARSGSPRVVCIDGPSGSGKSTTGAALSAAIGHAPVVHMDDIYPGWDGLDDAVPRLMEWVLQPLAAGQQAGYRRFDWDAGQYAEWHDVPEEDVLIVEGCGCGSTACAPYTDLLIWVEAPRDERFRRGIQRDGEAYRPHWTRWQQQEDAMFSREETRARADLIIDGTQPLA